MSGQWSTNIHCRRHITLVFFLILNHYIPYLPTINNHPSIMVRDSSKKNIKHTWITVLIIRLAITINYFSCLCVSSLFWCSQGVYCKITSEWNDVLKIATVASHIIFFPCKFNALVWFTRHGDDLPFMMLIKLFPPVEFSNDYFRASCSTSTYMSR